MPDVTTSRSKKLFEDLKEFFKAIYRYMGCFGEMITDSFDNTKAGFLRLKARMMEIKGVKAWIKWISAKIKQFLIGAVEVTQIAIATIIDVVAFSVLSIILTVYGIWAAAKTPFSEWKLVDSKGNPEISWLQKLMNWFGTKYRNLKDEVTPLSIQQCLNEATLNDAKGIPLPPDGIPSSDLNDDMLYSFDENNSLIKRKRYSDE